MIEKLQDDAFKLSEDEASALWRSLLHKEGSWVDWGKGCQKLQKAGYQTQEIFEQTGFQGSHQNLIIVAVQVYESLVNANVSEDILTYYQGPRSDVLYELRILNQDLRASAAQLAYEKKLDVDGAKDAAKAIQDFYYLSQLPSGFTNHPGDAVAYQCWKRAKQKKDLSERSRFIAQGLKFAHSQTAREAIEQLLNDFTITPTRTAPLMPLHRLEEEEELSRIIPVVGTSPLSAKDLENVASLVSEEPFHLVRFSGTVSIVPLPGWQVILKAKDPVAIFCQSDQLPKSLSGKLQTVLVVVDRALNLWNVDSYFLIEKENLLTFQWFEEDPNITLFGQVLVVLRAKKILDENNLLEPWQMDD